MTVLLLSLSVNCWGVQPKRAWLKGSQRQTPTGAVLAGIHEDSYLSVLLAEVKVEQLTSEVDQHIIRLERYSDFFENFSKNGGVLELFIGFVRRRNFWRDIRE